MEKWIHSHKNGRMVWLLKSWETQQQMKPNWDNGLSSMDQWTHFGLRIWILFWMIIWCCVWQMGKESSWGTKCACSSKSKTYELLLLPLSLDVVWSTSCNKLPHLSIFSPHTENNNGKKVWESRMETLCVILDWEKVCREITTQRGWWNRRNPGERVKIPFILTLRGESGFLHWLNS